MVYTDVFQAIIMLAGILAIMIKVKKISVIFFLLPYITASSDFVLSVMSFLDFCFKKSNFNKLLYVLRDIWKE